MPNRDRLTQKEINEHLKVHNHYDPGPPPKLFVKDKYLENAKTIFNRDGDCTGIGCENCPARTKNKNCGELWNGRKRAMIDWFRNYIKENDPSVIKNPLIGATSSASGSQNTKVVIASELLKQPTGYFKDLNEEFDKAFAPEVLEQEKEKADEFRTRAFDVSGIGPDSLLKQKEGKPRLTLVPRKIITAIAKVREYENKKYKTSDSWKLNTAEDYRDAAYRHWLAYLDDPDSLDEESGLLHLHHLATNIAFLIEGGFKGE